LLIAPVHILLLLPKRYLETLVITLLISTDTNASSLAVGFAVLLKEGTVNVFVAQSLPKNPTVAPNAGSLGGTTVVSVPLPLLFPLVMLLWQDEIAKNKTHTKQNAILDLIIRNI